MTERILPRPARIASIAAANLEDARRLLAAVPSLADAIEFRADLADDSLPPARLIDLDPRPIVVTYRTASEGGSFTGSREEYARATRAAYEAGATVDVEHASGLLAADGAFPDRRRVIVSRHSVFSAPPDPRGALAGMLETGARAVKLVAGSADLASSLLIAGLQKEHGPDSPVSIFPMGPASPPGRILSALFGGSLVYGPVGRDTAAGQVPLSEMLDTYEVHRPRALEALYGIVGQEVSRSLSPFLYNALFRSRGLPFLYLPLPLADFDRVRPQELEFDPRFRGFSVTRPWKRRAAETAIPSEDVQATGAANTLSLDRRRWLAANTDVDGIFDPLADHDTGEGRTAVILGAGGVARAAIVAARKLGYEVLIASRGDEDADALAEELRVDSLAWEDVQASEADLYVNATPVGSDADDPPAIPVSALAHRPLIFDCVYRRDGSETPTVVAARRARCPVVDGMKMFAAQALRQARIFGVADASLEEIERLLGLRAARP